MRNRRVTNSWRRQTFLVALATIASITLFAERTAHAQFTATFDESGSRDIPPDVQSLKGVLAPDPSQPTHPLVLTFMLPETVWTGDVGIYEDFVGGTLSDALRFTNANGDHGLTPDGDRMIFYSDNDSDPADGPGALADTGIPPLVSSPAWDVVEIPNEGLNSFTYVAGTPFAANVYFAFSDGVGIFDIPNIPPDDLTSPGAPSPVPEPSTISFATIGMLLLLARLRFRPTRGAHPTSPGTP